MILIEIDDPNELPSIREVEQLHFLRLAVVEAYRAGDPIPACVDEAAAYLRRQHSPRLWSFFTVESAERWANLCPGHLGDALRYIVRDFMATKEIKASMGRYGLSLHIDGGDE